MSAKKPMVVDLSAKDVATPRQLGALADAILTERVDRILVSFGQNANNPAVTTTFARWMARNDRFVRERVKAIAVVAPSLWVRIQWRLYMMFVQPPMGYAIVGNEAKALKWLEEVA